jgi:multiple sugar transport system permease protein
MLFIAAGLTTIPPEIYEAATIDGAGKWKQFLTMTLPMLKNHLFIVTLMVTNATLQSSESIYALTKGGPGYNTETIAVRMFKNAFVYNELRTGAAFGILLLLIAVIFIFLYRKVLNVQEGEANE